ncbi:MAG: GNAT family N-acetyltransferase [Anaerolineae bacterium]|jgi:GNAT superfamily N-acetyltransferase|nr:GNAT family N-acetyltransferase [Anaerolineae bacterium]
MFNVNPESTITITTIRSEHVTAIETISSPDDHEWNYKAGTLLRVSERFPEGQLVALYDGIPVAYAVTMRTHYSPSDVPLSWWDMIGRDLSVPSHHADGDWLYGIDFAVHPHYRRHGIGTLMYNARFELVKRLNLRGMYAGGMLMGYHRYRDQMTVREYGERVMRGELEDPTVTMQMRRGFKPRAVIENYVPLPDAGGAAMLIEWRNPHYKPLLQTIVGKREIVIAPAV